MGRVVRGVVRGPAEVHAAWPSARARMHRLWRLLRTLRYEPREANQSAVKGGRRTISASFLCSMANPADVSSSMSSRSVTTAVRFTAGRERAHRAIT